MVTRLEFCLGQLLPPFPGGLWKAIQHHGGDPEAAGPPGRGPSVLCSLPRSFSEPLRAAQLCRLQATPRYPFTGKKALGIIYSE